MTNNNASPAAIYCNYSNVYSSLCRRIGKTRDLISNLRLVTVVLALTGAVVFYRMGHRMCMGADILGGTVLFVILAVWHATLFRKYDEYTTLTELNRRGTNRCGDKWNEFPQNGGEFIDKEHPYSSDLDLFGPGSLYQYMSCAHTWYGKRTLSALLDRSYTGDNNGTFDRDAIIARQEAVEELAGCFSWRQLFECCGYDSEVGNNPEKLIMWGESDEADKKTLFLYTVATIGGPITVVSLITAYFLCGNVFPALPFLMLNMILTVVRAQKNLRLFNIFEKNARGLSIYSRMMQRITLQPWRTVMLKNLCSSIAGGKGASAALHRLASVVSASEVRFSPLPWLFANALFLWDIRCAGKLAQWKMVHGHAIRIWFNVAGTFEALASLSVVCFDNPEWIFPEISSRAMAIEATGMGHPLLPASNRIVNKCTAGAGPGAVNIITGSNMSGKSTFLRTIGCNLVLAYAGAPVCARTFTCGIYSLYTSMRTGDDLLSHTSTFYAELLRVKKIVDAAATGDPLVYLLDELFRGTNSADRHDGAVALINKLSLSPTLGFIATHDMELCQLASTCRNVTNYHFQEWYEDGAIRFDYLLRSGPSTTRNALYLMQMVGIDISTTSDKSAESVV